MLSDHMRDGKSLARASSPQEHLVTITSAKAIAQLMNRSGLISRRFMGRNELKPAHLGHRSILAAIVLRI